jgi:arginyl-tRNA synthetase
VDPEAQHGPIRLEAPTEQTLGRVLARFPEVVHQASESGLPHLITDHLYELARAYSAFFEACPVLKSRLGLCALTGRQMKRGLELLGIQVVERM